MAYITAVRLKAFKSVAGGWQEFRFDRGLNAIVGPNGCGKSSLLDALCFAFAAPPRSFAAASLADLANSDSSEVCEVSVSLRSASGEAHAVSVALTPGGGRAFRVNGRVRSGREVREFLRGLGICLDSGAAVIKQAQVTRLADANSPADLAALVAEASGLGRWNEEVAAAAEELKRTRRALAEVQACLLTLERGAAASEEQLKAAERHALLEHEAAGLAQQLAEALQAAVAAAAAAAHEGAAAAEAAGRDVDAAQQALEDAQAAQAAAGVAAAEQQSIGWSDAVLLSLQQRLAAAEEEVRLLTAQQLHWSELECSVQHEQAAMSSLAAASDRAAAEAKAASQAHRQLEAALRLAESAASAQSLASAVAAEVQQLEAAVASGEQAAAAAAAAVQGSELRLAELQSERSRAEDALQTAQLAAADAQLTGATAQLQRQQAKVAQLRHRESQLAQEAGTLAARLGGSSGNGWRPLHACFSFADPAAAQGHATALQVLAGGKLAVAVADSMEAAGRLLDSGTRQRIWPLDSLLAADHTQQQRRAAEAFQPGQVTLPLDLLRFEPRFRPAILRAFGSHVLAASDAVAEQLITRFGVPSITPDGRVTSHGTLQGGWRGSDSGVGNAADPMQLKMSLSAVEVRLETVRREVSSAEAALAEAHQQTHSAQEAAAALEAAEAELAAAEAELRACTTQLAAQHAAAADAKLAAVRAQANLAAKRQLVSSLASGSSDSIGNAASLAALQTEQRRLADVASHLEAAACSAAAELAAAADRLAAAEDALALAALPADWEERLSERRNAAAVAAASLAMRQAELTEASAAAASRQQAAEVAGAQVSAAVQALAGAKNHAACMQRAFEQLAAEQLELEQQLEVLSKEVPELQLAAAPLHFAAGAAGGEPSLAALRRSCSQLARQRQHVLIEQRSSSAAPLPLAEQLRLREQQATLSAARQQAATLATAAQRLQEGIDSSSSQVLAANEAVFEAVANSFASLTAAVLPAYHVRLRKVGTAVHEGLQLEFAHRNSSVAAADGCDSETAAGSSGAAAWRSGLDVLSGGQRTMVSLAFVVSVAMAGASTSLFLMDEVDAALDETNQHLVARLFDSLSASTAVSCSQVLCVSHNAAFQQLCSRVVRLTRGVAGTMPADGDGRAGGGSKAGDVAGRKRARSA